MSIITLSTSDLLNAWERGLDRSPHQRALSLLMAASPDESPNRLVEMSIGQVNSKLLKLREFIFGSKLDCAATCPGCNEQLEFAFDTQDARRESDTVIKEPLSICAEGYVLHFRLPNLMDLMAASGSGDIGSARTILQKRCIIEATKDGKVESSEDLPRSVADAVSARMSDIDPLADVQLSITCPGCGHVWQASFDIASFLWNEIDAWAQRTLMEVHSLASAYGWSEADILNMSPWRRQFYLGVSSG